MGVAVLAAVGHFTVQSSILVTTRYVTPSPLVVAKARPEFSRDPVAPAAPIAPSAAATGASALPAIERLGDAVEAAAAMPAADRLRRAQAAASEVKAKLVELHGASAGTRADAALRSASRLIQLSSVRQQEYEQYIGTLARVDAELQGSLDRAWKILGRVVTRQSVVAMNREFDELQRQAVILRDDTYLPLEGERLQVLEDRFGAALAEGTRGARRAAGANDEPSIADDFAQAQTLSARLLAADAERTTAMPRFHGQLAVLREQLLTPATVQPLFVAPVPDEPVGTRTPGTGDHRRAPVEVPAGAVALAGQTAGHRARGIG